MGNNDIELLVKLAELASTDTSQTSEQMKKISKSIREKILNVHLENYKIYFCDSDKRFHSYLPDATKQKKRKPIAKKTREELEDVIVDFYLQRKEDESITLENYFPIWLEAKEKETGNSNYAKRIYDDWRCYYTTDPIIHKSLTAMKTLELKEWAQNKVTSLGLTKKQYINMSIIIRQVYDYLVEHEVMQINPYRQFKINKKLYATPPKKQKEKEVFGEDEEKLAKKYLWELYLKDSTNTTPLAVMLNFYLGLRAGELVALRNCDINSDGKYITIQRMEAREFYKTESGEYRQIITVAPHTKTDMGNRDLYLVPDARKIISKIQESNRNKGLPCDPESSLFYNQRNTPLRESTLEKCYRRMCENLGIVRKSNHKVRKTCITKLTDNPDINLKEAMEFAGHKDVQVFIENYCFSRYSKEKTQNEFEKALCN